MKQSRNGQNSFLFYLKNHNSGDGSVKNGRTGEVVAYPQTYNVALVDEINDPETGKRRVIRYLPGEPLYVDEQSNPKLKGKDAPQTEMATFSHGRLVVSSRQTGLLDWLRNSNFNEDNPNRDPDKPAIFKEYAPGKAAGQAIERALEEHKNQSWCFEESIYKVAAMAEILGVKKGLAAEDTRFNMVQYSKLDPVKFASMLADDRIQAQIYVRAAVAKGEIIFEPQNNHFKWKSGVSIMTAPMNEDPFEAFAELKYTDKGGPIFNKIDSIVDPGKDAVKEQKVKEAEEGIMSSAEDKVDDMNDVQLIEKALELFLIEKKGPWLVFDGQNIGIGKAKSAEVVQGNHDLKERLKAALKEHV